MLKKSKFARRNRTLVEPLDRRVLFAAGGVDLTFGGANSGGVAVNDLRTSDDQLNAVAVTSDGALLLAGTSAFSNGQHKQAFLAQIRTGATNPGKFDTSFSNGAGKTFDSSSTSDLYATSVTVLRDGQIALAGEYVTAGADGIADSNDPQDVAPFLQLYSAAGIPASTQGFGAVEGAGYGPIVGVSQTSDGNLLYLTSHIGSSGLRDFFVRKATLDTRPFTDPGGSGPFSINGFVETNVGGTNDTPVGIFVAGDDSVLVAGTAAAPDGSGSSFVLVRYLADGSLDTSFGNNGTVVTAVGQIDMASSFAIQPDGRILIGGSVATPTGTIPAVLRYDPTGTLDTTFASNGVLMLPDMTGTGGGAVTSIVVQQNRQVILGIKDASSVSVARLTTLGALDTSFGDPAQGAVSGNSTGITHIPFNDAGSKVSMVLSADQKSLFVGGTLLNSKKLNPTTDSAVVRLSVTSTTTTLTTAAAGTLDPNFGNDGIQRTVLSQAAITTVATTTLQDPPDAGKILSAGYTAAGDFSITRFNVDGTIDGTFGDFGFSKASFRNLPDVTGSVATSLVVQKDGDIVIAGYSILTDGSTEICLARFTASGAPDDNFGRNGIANNGTSLIDLSGVLNQSEVSAVANAIALAPDGSFYLAGAIGAGDAQDAIILHVNEFGFLDTTYANAGLANVGTPGVADFASAIALQGGDVLFAGGEADSDGRVRFLAGRLTATAAPDPAFGIHGRLTISAGGTSDVATTIGISPQNNIVLGGTSLLTAADLSSSGANSVQTDSTGEAARAVLIGLTSAGQLDTSFGTSGITTVSIPGAPLASINKLMVDSLGRVLASAAIATSSANVFASAFGAEVLRFNSNGTLDTSFNQTGYIQPFQPPSVATAAPSSQETLAGSFQNLYNSAQGVLSMVSGGEVLSLATMAQMSTSTTYQTAAIITEIVSGAQSINGGTANDPKHPDLVPTLTVKVPSAGSLLGAKITVVLDVQNLGKVAANGKFNISLLLSKDGQLPTPAFFKTIQTATKIKYNAHQKFQFTATLPASKSVSGGYFIAARIDPVPGSPTSHFSYSFTQSQIAILPPYVDIHGTFVAAPKHFSPGINKYSFLLQNSGNQNFQNKVSVNLYASTDPIFDPGDPLLFTDTKETLHLNAGQSHRYNFSLVFTPSAELSQDGPFYLAAVIDYPGEASSTRDNELVTVNPIPVGA